MRPGLLLVAAICLWASSPPAWFPGGGFLVLPGWMAFYALSDPARCKRPLLAAYVVGVVHMLAFSFSVRHVMFAAYVAIGVLGGLYYLLVSYWTRVLGRFVPGGLAFGLAVAGSCWLRGHFTEIQYPHVQPIHCLYQWPSLLGSLRWGSEVFGNVLIGALSGTLVDFYRAWRLARPSFVKSRIVSIATVSLLLLSSLVPPPSLVPSPSVATGDAASIDVLLVEPGLRPEDLAVDSEEAMRRLIHERVVGPTVARAGIDAEDPPDLVVWPESMGGHRLEGSAENPTIERVLGFRLHDGVRLLQGSLLHDELDRTKVIALLVDHEGSYLGHHEKQKTVPGGEHVAFVDWLPAEWADPVRRWFEDVVRMRVIAPGEPRPLLEAGQGVPFGAMVCFDNAFPEVSEDLVRRGARFLVVISNENWYRGGAELDQMVAMTVCRAIECSIPLVRCTVDGRSLVVGPDGRVTDDLRPAPDGAGRGRILPLRLEFQPGIEGTVPPLHRLVRWIVLLSLLPVVVLALGSWGRLVRGRSRKDRPS